MLFNIYFTWYKFFSFVEIQPTSSGTETHFVYHCTEYDVHGLSQRSKGWQINLIKESITCIIICYNTFLFYMDITWLCELPYSNSNHTQNWFKPNNKLIEKSISIRELSFFTRRGGRLSVMTSPHFFLPLPLCIRGKILVPPLPTGKDFGPPLAYWKKFWSPHPRGKDMPLTQTMKWVGIWLKSESYLI